MRRGQLRLRQKLFVQTSGFEQEAITKKKEYYRCVFMEQEECIQLTLQMLARETSPLILRVISYALNVKQFLLRLSGTLEIAGIGQLIELDLIKQLSENQYDTYDFLPQLLTDEIKALLKKIKEGDFDKLFSHLLPMLPKIKSIREGIDGEWADSKENVIALLSWIAKVEGCDDHEKLRTDYHIAISKVYKEALKRAKGARANSILIKELETQHDTNNKILGPLMASLEEKSEGLAIDAESDSKEKKIIDTIGTQIKSLEEKAGKKKKAKKKNKSSQKIVNIAELCKINDIEGVHTYILSKRSDPSKKKKSDLITLEGLQIACKAGHEKMVDCLLKNIAWDKKDLNKLVSDSVTTNETIRALLMAQGAKDSKEMASSSAAIPASLLRAGGVTPSTEIKVEVADSKSKATHNNSIENIRRIDELDRRIVILDQLKMKRDLLQSIETISDDERQSYRTIKEKRKGLKSLSPKSFQKECGRIEKEVDKLTGSFSAKLEKIQMLPMIPSHVDNKPKSLSKPTNSSGFFAGGGEAAHIVMFRETEEERKSKTMSPDTSSNSSSTPSTTMRHPKEPMLLAHVHPELERTDKKWDDLVSNYASELSDLTQLEIDEKQIFARGARMDAIQFKISRLLVDLLTMPSKFHAMIPHAETLRNNLMHCERMAIDISLLETLSLKIETSRSDMVIFRNLEASFIALANAIMLRLGSYPDLDASDKWEKNPSYQYFYKLKETKDVASRTGFDIAKEMKKKESEYFARQQGLRLPKQQLLYQIYSLALEQVNTRGVIVQGASPPKLLFDPEKSRDNRHVYTRNLRK